MIIIPCALHFPVHNFGELITIKYFWLRFSRLIHLLVPTKDIVSLLP
jgi:hypothetical protein